MNKMEWIKGLPPIHKISISYLFKYKHYNTKGDLYWFDYFLATPTDSRLQDCNIDNIWYFNFMKNLGEVEWMEEEND